MKQFQRQKLHFRFELNWSKLDLKPLCGVSGCPAHTLQYVTGGRSGSSDSGDISDSDDGSDRGDRSGSGDSVTVVPVWSSW